LCTIIKTNENIFKLRALLCTPLSGDTTVTAVVCALVGLPSHLKPNCGDVEVSVTLSPVASGKYDRTKSDEAVLLEGAVSRITIDSGIVDLSQLCISEGELVFVLRVHIMCLSNAGNLFDACILASALALSDTKLPSVTFENGIAIADPSSPLRPLILSYIPVPVTIGLFEDHILIDPSSSEEGILDGTFTVVVTPEGSIVHMMQSQKGLGVSGKMLQQILQEGSLESLSLRRQMSDTYGCC
jgi:exosome complex component RRP43